ncbi:polysaccharide biosynthesis protein [Micromonospora sp. BRA006-A]|nr:polysaccharide biosynthesis protein [Micromonospora sp. BRA006-A]
MTVQEAVHLVLQAATIGRGGEALVLDMGEPVRIADVARRLAAEADRPVEIVFTGLRPGEAARAPVRRRRGGHPAAAPADLPRPGARAGPGRGARARPVRRPGRADQADGRVLRPGRGLPAGSARAALTRRPRGRSARVVRRASHRPARLAAGGGAR